MSYNTTNIGLKLLYSKMCSALLIGDTGVLSPKAQNVGNVTVLFWPTIIS